MVKKKAQNKIKTRSKRVLGAPPSCPMKVGHRQRVGCGRPHDVGTRSLARVLLKLLEALGGNLERAGVPSVQKQLCNAAHRYWTFNWLSLVLAGGAWCLSPAEAASGLCQSALRNAVEDAFLRTFDAQDGVVGKHELHAVAGACAAPTRLPLPRLV